MKKAIIALTGTPEGKNAFAAIIKESAWIRNLNPKNYLSGLGKNYLAILDKSLFGNDEREEEYRAFIQEFRLLANKYFNFEKDYVRDFVERKFLADTSEKKVSLEGDTFEILVLITHGLSRDVVSFLQEEYKAIQVHVTNRSLNTNVETHDLTLYYEDEDFSERVKSVLFALTSNQIGD